MSRKMGLKGYASKRESLARRFDAWMIRHPGTALILILAGILLAGVIERATVGWPW